MLAFPPFPAPASVSARLLNGLLRREDWAAQRLARHAGKTVRFVAFPWDVSLSIGSDGLVEVSDPSIVPDVTLTLPRDGLMKLPAVLKRGDTDEITALLHIEGDAGLAQVVSELARGLRWDAEDDLARVVGDVAAVRIVSAARTLVRGAGQSAVRTSENLGEYLVEESRQVLGRHAFEDWRNRINEMAQRLNKLEHRVERLERGHTRMGPA